MFKSKLKEEEEVTLVFAKVPYIANGSCYLTVAIYAKHIFQPSLLTYIPPNSIPIRINLYLGIPIYKEKRKESNCAIRYIITSMLLHCVVVDLAKYTSFPPAALCHYISSYFGLFSSSYIYSCGRYCRRSSKTRYR